MNKGIKRGKVSCPVYFTSESRQKLSARIAPARGAGAVLAPPGSLPCGSSPASLPCPAPVRGLAGDPSAGVRAGWQRCSLRSIPPKPDTESVTRGQLITAAEPLACSSPLIALLGCCRGTAKVFGCLIYMQHFTVPPCLARSLPSAPEPRRRRRLQSGDKSNRACALSLW